MHSDPTPIIDLFRGNHATEILVAAVAHLRIFDLLAAGPEPAEKIAADIGLARRPAMVLFTALRAMQLLQLDSAGYLGLTPLAKEHLVPGGPRYIGDYLGLAAQSPGVTEFVQRLRTNRPAGAEEKDVGAAYIFREGTESAMDHEASARTLTLALSGRARNVAPVLAERYPLGHHKRLLDVGGGTGIYSIEFLRKNPKLTAVVWDRAEVLKVAKEIAAASGVGDRIEFVAGDMFTDHVPPGCDVVLLSNILHDWDEPECRALIGKCASPLPSGGAVLIHDVFLDDSLDGPLPVALYSAALFSLTEGRAYSAAEYRTMVSASANLTSGEVTPTLIHCGVMPAIKK
jgi:SAM-dependent methyltransferase